MALYRLLTYARLALPLLLIWLVGCGGPAPASLGAAPATEVLERLPPLPPRDAPRLASTPFTTTIEGNETFSRGGNIDEFGLDIYLRPPAGGTAWGLYQLSTDGLEVISTLVRLDVYEGAAYLAISDYDARTWRIVGPLSSDEHELPFGEWALAVGDRFYVAVLACRSSDVRVNRLELTVDRPGWTIYDLPWSAHAGNGVDLFVQDGVLMMAHAGMLAYAIHYARATETLPTTAEQWVHFTVVGTDVYQHPGTPLAAASIAGRPAIAFTDREEWQICYAWPDSPEPTELSDWTLSTIHDDAGATGHTIGLAECVGTPRVAFDSGYSPGHLAAADTSQPADEDWVVTDLTDAAGDTTRVNLTAIDDRPVACLITNVSGGKGLHVGYADSDSPIGPAAWNIVPVHNWLNAGSWSSIGQQQIDGSVRPVVSYINDYWTGAVYVARPLLHYPVDALDWVRCYLDGRSSGTDLAVVDNRPVIIYCQEEDEAIRVALATTAEFEDATDFEIFTLQQDFTPDTRSVAAAAVGDVPVIAWRDTTGSGLKFGFFVD